MYVLCQCVRGIQLVIVIKLDKLEQILLKHKNQKFLVIEPGGNNGDKLTYMGMEKKLRELGIDYSVLRYEERARSPTLHKLYFGMWKKTLDAISVLTKLNNTLETTINKMDKKIYERTVTADEMRNGSRQVVLIHGGANLNDLWGHGIRLLKNVIQHNPHSVIIVGPQTYWFRGTRFPELFSNKRQGFYLFCRERYSYNLLNSMTLPKNVHIYLSHDTALYLSKNDFHPQAGVYDLICLRRDKESVIFPTADYLRYLQKRILFFMPFYQVDWNTRF